MWTVVPVAEHRGSLNTNIDKQPHRLHIGTLVVLGVLASVVFMLGQAGVHSIQDNHTFLHALFFPTMHETIIRFGVAFMFVVGAASAQIALDRSIAVSHAAEDERDRLLQVYGHSPDGVMCIDREFIVRFVNPATEHITGLSADELVGQRCHDVIVGTSEACAHCKVAEVFATGEVSFGLKHDVHASNGEHFLEQLWYPILGSDGHVDSVVEVTRDITGLMLAERELRQTKQRFRAEIKQRDAVLNRTTARLEQEATERERAEQLVERIAFTDSLTALPNRALFDDRLDMQLRASTRDGAPFAVLMIDVDRIRDTADTLGSAVVDLLLMEVAERIQPIMHDSDTVARYGSNVFAILMPEVGTEHHVEAIIDTILDAVREPVDMDGTLVEIRLSIGTALYPDNATTASDIVRAADLAMFAAKEAGVRWSVSLERLWADAAIAAS